MCYDGLFAFSYINVISQLISLFIEVNKASVQV